MLRAKLKADIVARLDSIAKTHSLGHQTAYANRYVLPVTGGKPVELMFEKGGTGNANLWVRSDVVNPISTDRILQRDYPAKDLNKLTNKGGKVMYGRHPALRPMDQLGLADLTRYTLKSVAQLDQIVANLNGS